MQTNLLLFKDSKVDMNYYTVPISSHFLQLIPPIHTENGNQTLPWWYKTCIIIMRHLMK